MTNKPDKKTRLLEFEATIENIKTIEDLKIDALLEEIRSLRRQNNPDER